MELEYLAAVVVAALVVSALVHGLIAVWLKGAIVRALASSADGTGSGGVVRASTEAGDPERFTEIAPELVNLARAATGTAIRHEEVHEWHQLDLFPLGTDDISEAVREKVRRAAFDAVAARSALVHAVRRHRSAIPAPLEAELSAFCERLEPGDGGSRLERKRRLATELDALESRLRDALVVDRGPASA